MGFVGQKSIGNLLVRLPLKKGMMLTFLAVFISADLDWILLQLLCSTHFFLKGQWPNTLLLSLLFSCCYIEPLWPLIKKHICGHPIVESWRAEEQGVC